MASSNRHWPSMFKSKPCNHHSSLLSNSCARSSDNSPFSSRGCEERSTPEPKPRWNPKPEQIRILEAIFNSGMVNPPRDEIRRIRAQLQEYGQVGDANVFYWFQNRKSRSKNKQRTFQSKSTVTATATATTLSSSSSSSDKNNNSPNNSSNNRIKIGNKKNNNNNNLVGGEQFGNSPTSVNQCNENNYFHQIITPNNHFNNNNNNNHNNNNGNNNNNNINNNNTHDFISHEPVFFPLHQSGVSVVGNNFSQGLCFANNNMMSGGDPIHVSASSDQTVGGFSSLLFGDMFNGGGLGGGGGGELKRDEVEKLKYQHELSFLVSTPSATNTCTLSSPSPVVSTPTTSTAISSNLGQILGEVGGMVGKSTVFINGMAIEVPCAPFNVKEEFGEDVMLVNASTGHPVMTNEWGVTLHALQHGASYYLVNAQVVASPLIDKLHSTSDLLASEFPYQI
ncbi:WUSCHEL-related homeobox 9-like [Silene latifolia]|uniref:WUSCHEL-related homeobox 9-like n=1 Tax=Silene latifolia TaxID=37657 RepID=UPI003D76F112